MTIFIKTEKPYVNEYNKQDSSTDSNPFKARPLKHWRKVLCCKNNCNNCNKLTKEIFKPNISECGSCDPKKIIIKSAQTEKLINPINCGEPGKIKYSHSNLTYLKSKCKTYNQQISGLSTDINDKTKRTILNCATGCKTNSSVTFTYKPNNEKFSQQGAVSAASRLHRLKYNTITNNATSFKSAYGASAQSAGSYKTYGDPPYFIKSNINNNCNNRPLMKYRQHSQVCI
jgi:hypothetical protein